jgi:hypothetical protein
MGYGDVISDGSVGSMTGRFMPDICVHDAACQSGGGVRSCRSSVP